MGEPSKVKLVLEWFGLAYTFFGLIKAGLAAVTTGGVLFVFWEWVNTLPWLIQLFFSFGVFLFILALVGHGFKTLEARSRLIDLSILPKSPSTPDMVDSVEEPTPAAEQVDKAPEDRIQHSDVTFPPDLYAVVKRFQPDFRLPDSGDVAGEWADNFDSETLSPMLCSGDFTGRGVEEYACFVIGEEEVSYKVVILTETNEGHPELIELEENRGRPQGRYVANVQRGQHAVSRAVWKHRGLKTLHLRREAIEVGTYESAACIYYWDDEGNRFLKQWISD